MKFAFLAHPLSQEHRALLAVDDAGSLRRNWGGDIFQFCQILHSNLKEFHGRVNFDQNIRVVDELRGLISAKGISCEGRFYEIPMDAAQILNDPNRALGFMEQAVDDAAAWGAEVVGLGSMTGIVGSHGQHLADRGPIAITTGNSLTVFSAYQNLLRACELTGIKLEQESIAIVGIPGSIGAALAKLLKPVCRELICVARTASSRAKQLAAELDCALLTSIPEALKSARIVLSATSSGDCINQDWLLPGSLVIDVAVPTDVIGGHIMRDDILVLTGGMLLTPETMSRESMFIGFNHGMVPSCFGETMLLALENRRECFSVGRNLRIEGILEIGSVAIEHGFDFSKLSSMGVPVDGQQISRFKKSVKRSRDNKTASGLSRPELVSSDGHVTLKNGHAIHSRNGQIAGSKNGQVNHSQNGHANHAPNGYANVSQKEDGTQTPTQPPLPFTSISRIDGFPFSNQLPENNDVSNGFANNFLTNSSENPTKQVAATPSDLSRLAEDQYQRYINPVLAALGKSSGFLKTFVRGDGCCLWDDAGNQYLDFVAGFGSLNLGHNHPAISNALQTAMSSQAPGFAQAAVNPYAAALADRLVSCSPIGLEMVSFSNSGAESIEAAIKLVRIVSDRSRILYCHGSYHGKTLGALSITGNRKFQKPFSPLIDGMDAVEFGDSQRLAEALKSRKYAAFFVEPIQCEGGMRVPPAGYLNEVESLCRETNTLFVLDEIQTGLGRTGKLFCADHFGISPDIMTLAKSLGGGMIPCGAMLCRSRLWMKAYGSVENFALHSSTFAGGSLAMAAGLATLDVLEQSDLLENCQRRSEQLRAGLDDLAGRNDLIAEVRGQGLLMGIEFNPLPSKIVRHFAANDATGVSHFLAPQALEAIRNLAPIYVMQTLLDEFGIYTQIARSMPSVLRVQPPLCVSEAQIDSFLNALEKCCDEFSFSNRITDSMIAKSTVGKLDKKSPAMN